MGRLKEPIWISITVSILSLTPITSSPVTPWIMKFQRNSPRSIGDSRSFRNVSRMMYWSLIP